MNRQNGLLVVLVLFVLTGLACNPLSLANAVNRAPTAVARRANATSNPGSSTRRATVTPGAPQNSGINLSNTIHLKYQASFNGKLSVAGTREQTVSGYKDCLDYFVNNPSGLIGFDGNLQGHDVSFSIAAVTIKGPGTFAPDRDGTNWLIFDGSQEDLNFNNVDRGDTKITINPDGSGRIVITGWGNPGDELENGIVMWTCTL